MVKQRKCTWCKQVRPVERFVAKPKTFAASRWCKECLQKVRSSKSVKCLSADELERFMYAKV